MASISERIDTVKTDIDALVTYSNETTGESDTTISDAVEHLVDGYGGGSSDVLISNDYCKLYCIYATVEDGESIANTAEFAAWCSSKVGLAQKNVWGFNYEGQNPIYNQPLNGENLSNINNNIYFRYRNGANYAVWNNSQWDAAFTVGDVYKIIIIEGV